MRYCQQVGLAVTSGTVATQVFRANSIYDPDVTGVGHQPLGHDEWAVLYNNYKVKSARITITAGNNHDSVTPVISVTRTDSTVGSTGNMASICEQPNTKWMTLSNGDAGPSVKSLTMGYVGRKQYPNLRGDDTLRPAFGSDPAEGCYWVVQMQGIQGTESVTVPLLVKIDYIVELSVPKILTQS